MTELDPKGLEAAKEMRGYASTEAIIRAYLEAAPSPSPAPGVVAEALGIAKRIRENDGGTFAHIIAANDAHNFLERLASLARGGDEPSTGGLLAKDATEAQFLASPTQVTVDALAQEIRRVDGNHDLGAGALAEALMPFLTAAIGAGRSSEPEFETAPDNGTPAEVLAYVLECARRWVPEARIIGNARAGDIERAIAAIGAGGQAVASPVSDGYFIQERDDDMLICAKHWQYGSICIARRPKLATNDEWRSTAQDIVNALSAIAHPVQPGWRDMERAPKDGAKILYRNKFGGIGYCRWDEGYNEDEIACWWDSEEDDEVCPVAWLPADTLPAAPQPKGE